MLSRVSGRREAIAVLLGALLLALVVTWPLARVLTTLVPAGGPDAGLNGWILAWGAERLPHGLQGFWTPPAFYPYPNTLAYSENLLGVTLLVAPLVWAGVPLTLVYNVAFLLTLAISGGGAYLLARDATGSRRAAAIGAVAFVCLPYRIAQAGHLQVQALGWLPIALWAFHRLAERPSWPMALIFGASSVLQVLSYSYSAYQWALAIGVMFLWTIIRQPRARGALQRVTLVAVLVVLAIVPVWLVYRDIWGDRPPATGEILENAADAATYLAVPPSLPLARWLPGRWQAEGALFPGAMVTLLAGLALLPMASRARTAAIGASVAAQGGDGDGQPPRHRPSDEPMASRIAAGPDRWLFVLLAVIAGLISLGPEPRAWGSPLPIPSLYRLCADLPLFGALRVPARFGALVLLAASMLAAIGAAALLRRLTRSAGILVTAALVGLIVMESQPDTRELAAAMPRWTADETGAYAWLKQQPPGAVLELPIGGPALVNFGLEDQHAALLHQHPVINGLSRLETPLQQLLGGSASPLADAGARADVLPLLQGLGVRYLVVRPSRFREPAIADATLDELTRAQAIVARHTFGELRVLQLAADAAEGETMPGRPVPSPGSRAKASIDDDRLPLAFDGNPGTRWLSGHPQSGTEWITVDFDRPRRIAGLSITMTDRSLRDYPRRLHVTTGDGPDATVLFDGPILAAIGRAIRRAPHLPVVTVPFTPTDTTRLVLRQTGQSARWYWSIDELTLWER